MINKQLFVLNSANLIIIFNLQKKLTIFLSRYKIGTEFIQQVDGQEDKRQGEGVASGCDDGRQNEQHHDGMTAIMLKKAAAQHTD